MLYLLLILFPISMAAGCFVLRKRTELVIATAAAVLFTQMWLVVQLPLEEPSRFLGMTLSLNELNRLFMLVFLGIGVISFLATWHLPHGENFIPVTLLVLSFICAILLLQDPFIVSLLLIWVGIAAVLAIVDLPANAGVLVETRVIASALKYLMLMVIAGVLIYLGFILAYIYRPGELPGQTSRAPLILALLTAGFSLRLALIPFHTWLPDLVEDAAPLVSSLVIAIINTTSLIVLIISFQRFPSLLVDNPSGLVLLRVGALLTSVLAAIMSINQPSLRRTIGYLLIYNSGMIFYGLSSVSLVGLTGAIFEALNQALIVVLLMVSIALLEQPDGRPPGVVRRDLLRRWPVAGIAFIGGGLALLGCPPMNGFASKILLYQAASQSGWWELLLILFSTVLAGFAFFRLVKARLLGPSDDFAMPTPMLMDDETGEIDMSAARPLAPEPQGTAILVLLLLGVCLLIGLYPNPFLVMIQEVIRGLTFVSLQS
jgi:formate hydrogenlyase subunit 3/multisubunit Na+/H+ antiporter MnhD subunit